MRDRLLRDGFFILSAVFVGLRLFAIEPWAGQRRCLRLLDDTGDFYAAAETGRIGAYLYSPAFAQLLAPLTWLPLNVFVALWTALNCAALWWLMRRWAPPSLLFLPIPFEIISGNVHLFYAVAIVVGFRWSASWVLMFITKVTPGIGVLWFAVRREWRSLRCAGCHRGDRRDLVPARPGGVGGVDRDPPGRPRRCRPGDARHTGLVPRGAAAAAARGRGRAAGRRRSDRPPLVPFAVVAALPVLWLNGLAVLAAVVPLWQARSVGTAPAHGRAPASPQGSRAASTSTSTAARRSPLTDGRLALVAGLALFAILAIGLTPTILREQTRDWIAYEQAADRLTAGSRSTSSSSRHRTTSTTSTRRRRRRSGRRSAARKACSWSRCWPLPPSRRSCWW